MNPVLRRWLMWRIEAQIKKLRKQAQAEFEKKYPGAVDKVSYHRIPAMLGEQAEDWRKWNVYLESITHINDAFPVGRKSPRDGDWQFIRVAKDDKHKAEFKFHYEEKKKEPAHISVWEKKDGKLVIPQEQYEALRREAGFSYKMPTENPVILEQYAREDAELARIIKRNRWLTTPEK